MDSVHDMGGMDGFGSLDIEVDEPVFHAPWEGRVFAMNMALAAWGKWNLDASRHSRERIEPATYIASSYYQRWLIGIEMMAIEHGLITRQELDARLAELTAEQAAKTGEGV